MDAVVIGASAGAIDALRDILPRLPAKFGAAVIAVVHVPPDQPSLLHTLFSGSCKVEVKEAEDKEPLRPGVVYFAAPNYHLLVDDGPCLSLSCDPPVMFSRPSIDVLFESASDVFGDRLVGIVLTGANTDGAIGLSKICAAGGIGLVQDPTTAYSDTMPRAALKACSAAKAMTLAEIAARVALLGGVA